MFWKLLFRLYSTSSSVYLQYKRWLPVWLCCSCLFQKAIHVQGTFLVVWCVAEIRAEISHIVQSEYHKCSVIPNDDHTCHRHHLELQRGSQIQHSLSFLSPLASLCVHNPYLGRLRVLLINHLSTKSSRSRIIAFSDDGDAAYFACKISSQCVLIEWQWSSYGAAPRLL